MEFPFISNALKVFSKFIIQTSSNCAVTAQLQLVSNPDLFLSRFYISHVDIHNLHLLHQTNYLNKQKYMFQMW